MPATTSAASTPRARALAAALREARIDSGVGQRELARMLSISHTDLSLWENCHRVPNVETVAMILAALRTPPEKRKRILDLARNASEPNWLTVGMPGVAQQLAGVVESERAASSITEWSPSLIPGLLQTPDYARAIISPHHDWTSDAEPSFLLRMGRQEILSRSQPTRLVAMIGEAALRDPIVSSDLMADQLMHVVTASERPNVEVRVVPSNVGWHPGSAGPFVLYDFPEGMPVVYFEHFRTGAFVPDASDVQAYREAISSMRDLALGLDESMSFLIEIAKEWRSK